MPVTTGISTLLYDDLKGSFQQTPPGTPTEALNFEGVLTLAEGCIGLLAKSKAS